MTVTDYDALAARLQAVEDRLAIIQLLASYGPAVDSGDAEATAGIWTADGVYDSYPAPMHGHDDLVAMVGSDLHQGLINGGCAHLIGMPQVEVHGDTAVATGYSMLCVRDEATDGFRVWRVSANRWELTRTPTGWRTTNRVNRLLDGSAQARALLGAATQ